MNAQKFSWLRATRGHIIRKVLSKQVSVLFYMSTPLPKKKINKNKASSQQPYRGNSTEILYSTNHNSVWNKEQNDVQLLQSEEKQYKIQELL